MNLIVVSKKIPQTLKEQEYLKHETFFVTFYLMIFYQKVRTSEEPLLRKNLRKPLES